MPVSLNWNLEAVADRETVCFIEATADDPLHGVVAGDRIMNPVTHALIWATISVDLPGITALNAGEFYARVNFVESLTGPFLIRAEVDGKRPEGHAAFITEAEVLAHVGLTCNVSPMARTPWLKKWSRELDISVSRFEQKRREAEAA